MNQSVSFTAYLKDEYSKNFHKLAQMTDSDIEKLDKELAHLAGTGTKVSRSIGDIDKRIQLLSRTKKLTLDTSAIKFANQEIKALELEKAKLEGSDSGGGFMGMGQGAGFAVAGGGLALLAMLKSTGSAAVEATAKYQKYQAVLANMFQSQDKAASVMGMLSKFASETPFQVDELTSSFVKLKGQGFEPTLVQMKAIGDLAASKGKSFDQLTEAIIDAQTGEFERLKEFGVKAKTEGDKISFMFNEQKTTVKNSASAIREYLLGLGQAVGVTGAMEAISKTTGGQLSNMEDNFDLLYKAIGDRFKPEIDSAIGSTSSFVGYLKSLVEIKPEEAIRKQITELRVLQAQLNSTNITEGRRKELLDQIEKINPSILDGINKEAIAYDKLNTNITNVINSLSKKAQAAAYSTLIDESSQMITDQTRGQIMMFEKAVKMAEKYGLTDIMNDATKDEYMKMNSLAIALQGKKGMDAKDDRYFLQTDIENYGHSQDIISKYTSDVNKLKNKQDAFLKASGLTIETGVPDPETKTGGTDNKNGTGITGSGGSSSSSTPSISGASQVRNITIQIHNLVGGGVNVYSNTVKEGAAKIKDHVVEALVTSVNDANLAIGK